MNVAGIDYSTRAIDVVLVDLDDWRPPQWFTYELAGTDAFERAREVYMGTTQFDDTLAIGIEDPRGHNAGALYRIQGAILARLPRLALVQPWVPSAWRKAVGLPGNCDKNTVHGFAYKQVGDTWREPWPQDACDAYCIALATRNAITTEKAA